MTIIVVGDVNADLSAALERFPREGGDAAVASLSWSSGGSAANAATALARLGLPARLLARVGADPAAEVGLRAARAAGADLSALQIDPAVATGLCYAAVSPGGDRTFFSFRGANAALDAPDAGLLDDARWLHVSAYALIEGRQRATTLALIADAHARRLPISLDLCTLALHARRDEIRALLPQLTILFANQDELAALGPALPLPAAAAWLAEHGLPLAAIKQGSQGCLLATAAGAQHVPAYAVAAIDTSGCGDAFVAGFLAAHLRAAPLSLCGELGNALGALTATRYGAADALPDSHELRAFLALQPGGATLAALLQQF